MQSDTDDSILSQVLIFGHAFTPSRLQAERIQRRAEAGMGPECVDIARDSGGFTLRRTLHIKVTRYNR